MSLGNPKFKVGDKVTFWLKDDNGNKIYYKGEIYIVDAYGTFFQNEYPSYDIMVSHKEYGDILYKHIPETLVSVQPSGEVGNTSGFDPAIRRFESCLGCQFFSHMGKICAFNPEKVKKQGGRYEFCGLAHNYI